MLNELDIDESDIDDFIDADYFYHKWEAKMPKEVAKRLLQSQVEFLKAEIIRKEAVLIPQEQELMHLHHRVEELENEMGGL